MRRRHYNHLDAEFILEPLSPSVVKVMHRGQVGYFGINRDWNVATPYAWTTLESSVHDDGVENIAYFGTTPDETLRRLAGVMLSNQTKEDSQRINPEERKEAARRVLQDFLEELPD